MFTQISCGAIHTCALKATGETLCWGENFRGQLGTGNQTSSGSPVPVAGSHLFAAISAGWHPGGIVPAADCLASQCMPRCTPALMCCQHSGPPRAALKCVQAGRPRLR